MQYNFDPQIWGPSFWYVLHLITFGYPDQPSYIEQRGYHDFFINLQHVIPCLKCRKHYAKHLQEHPIGPYLNTKSNLVKWLVDMHNIINQYLNKPTINIEEAILAHSNPPIKIIVKNHCPVVKRTINWNRAFIILIIMSFIIYYYKFYKNPLNY
jgi:hypothetical protein